MRAIAETAHRHGLAMHLHGARLPSACEDTGASLREMTTDAGVDVLSLGGTQDGAMLAEAVVVLAPERAQGAEFLRKSLMQLASKARFVSAQLFALYDGALWLENARHANTMAELLRLALREVDGGAASQTPQANSVFAVLPDAVAWCLIARVPFYFWNEPLGEVRFVCSFDTSEQDVEEFTAMLREELTRG